MVQSKEKTVAGYLNTLPADRRRIITDVRKVILKNLDKGFKETMNWGMICYEIPLKTYPETYNKKPLMYAALANQKQYVGIYLMSLYANPALYDELLAAYAALNAKPDMGKACIRFTKPESIPLDIIGKIIRKTTVKDYIAYYEASRKK